jgi:hypothetical protein
MAFVSLLALIPPWALGSIPWWLSLGLPALCLLSGLSLNTTIAAIERLEADPEYRPPTPQEMKRRGRLAARIYTGVALIAFPIVGYLIDGVPAAVFFLVLGGAGTGLGLWFVERRLSDH